MRVPRIVAPVAVSAAMMSALALPATAESTSDGVGAAACIVIRWWEPNMGDVTVDNNCANTVRMKARYAGLVWGKCEPVWGYTTRVWRGTWAPVTGLANC